MNLNFMEFELLISSFTVIQKVAPKPTDEDDENNLLPQWAIAMISIGLLSLVFVILFGVAVVSCHLV